MCDGTKSPAPAKCGVCFRGCEAAEGGIGACGARISRGGRMEPLYYGRLSSLALDLLEKQPMARFPQGSLILSGGSLG